jgi:flagellar basal-body rod protein FlgB
MEIKLFNTSQTELLKKALDVYAQKHEAIARNIANLDNPNYQPTRTDFNAVLNAKIGNSKIKTTNGKHIVTPHYMPHDISGQTDREKVDLTTEMAELAENQIRHEFVSQVLSGYYEKLRLAISGK